MRVVGIGSCLLQHLGVVERIPEPDFPREFDQFSTQGAGTTATAMVVLARWGVDAEFYGKVGDDHRGEQSTETLSGEGVNVEGVAVEPDAVTPLFVTVVETETLRRQMFFTQGNVSPLELAEMNLDLTGAKALVCDGTHVAVELHAMGQAKEANVPVILDAAHTHAQMREAVALSDVLICSERFASQFTGVGDLKTMCETLLERGPKEVVITLGDEGVAAMNSERNLVRVAAIEAKRVDASGAGDVYLGAFVYGLINGQSFEDRVNSANKAAGESCTGLGARSAIPDAT